MGVLLTRHDFKQQYTSIGQGLFIFEKEKHIPKDQQSINVGKGLSSLLLNITPTERRDKAPEVLRDMVDKYTCVTLDHIEILFTPSLDMNPVAVMLALCRNKKICMLWPGEIIDEHLIYEKPGSLEYYDVNYRGFIDTYIIAGGM